MTSIMGGTQLDLRQATMAPGEEAVIDVFAVMGGAIVRIPEGWIVDVQATSVMGGIKDQRRGNRENGPRKVSPKTLQSRRNPPHGLGFRSRQNRQSR